MDNVFVERLRQSVKCEEIYLREHATLPDLEAGLREQFERYNRWRPHQAHQEHSREAPQPSRPEKDAA